LTVKKEKFPAAYLLPALVLAGLVWGAPLIFSLMISFTDATPGGAGRLVGFANYLRAFSDPRFANSLLVSFLFASGVAVMNVGLGFGVAAALRSNPRARAVTQTALLFPWVLSELAVALIWGGFLDERTGLLNVALGGMVGERLLFKTTLSGAMGALWLASLWRGLAFSVMFQMAGLASLRPTLIHAARVDGARWWQIFRRIVWPHQSRVIALNGLIVFLMSLVSFSLPFALTKGGPMFATELVSLFAYNTAFGGSFELGYAAAQGMVVLLAYAFLAWALLKLRRKAT